MEKVLVTGVAGQLGYDVMRELEKRNIAAAGADIGEFDLTDEAAVLEFAAAARPTAIVHCAAYTAVDQAEDESEKAYAVNVSGSRNIALAARQAGAKLVYIGTDYVFDGEKDGAYDADDPKNPLCVYGKTKLRGEEECKKIVPERLFIVRLSWVFGKNGKNFVKTMLQLSENRNEISVVADQKGSPTYTPDAARLICDLTRTEKFGTYQVSNEGVCSWHEFATEIMRQSGRDMWIRPVTAAEYSTRARRPQNSVFSKKELDENGFARLPHWKDALKRFLIEMEEQPS
jgi:dTDP-4-dehydrorhamnose reductase